MAYYNPYIIGVVEFYVQAKQPGAFMEENIIFTFPKAWRLVSVLNFQSVRGFLTIRNQGK